MKKFIEFKDLSGKLILINIDNILYIVRQTDEQTSIYLKTEVNRNPITLIVIGSYNEIKNKIISSN